MLCPKCSRQNPDTAHFCRYCGENLDEATIGPQHQPPVQGQVCRVCGAPLKEHAHFCQLCGASVSQTPPPESAPAPQPKPRKKPRLWQNFLIAAASVAMLFAVVVGALYVTGYLDDILRAIGGTASRSDDEPVDRKQSVTMEKTPDEPPADEAAADRDTTDAADTTDAPADETPTEEAGVTQDAQDEPPISEPPIPPPVDAAPAAFAAEPLTSEELESAITDIRTKYNAIRDGITAGTYRAVCPRTGVTYYFSGNELIAVVMLRNVDDCAYSRSYYYSGGSVFFAYYEASDAYRLYVRDGRLIRLRYTPDASSNDDAINHDQETVEEYLQWEELVLSEAGSLYLSSLSAVNSEYILPDSDSRYLTEDDLAGLSAEQCRLARNEIYARHGRRFQDAGLQLYFDSCSWYSGTIDPADFSDSVFNEYERANSRLIVEYERAHGYTKR